MNEEARNQEETEDVDAQMRAISRRSFLWAGAAVVGAAGAFHFFDAQNPIPAEPNGIIWPLRKAEEFDDAVTSSLYSPHILSKTYTDRDITEARVNGPIGLDKGFDPSIWQLAVIGAKGGLLQLTLDDIKSMTRYEFVTEFKCIEGWSYFMKWAGARFADFFVNYPPAGKPKFVGMETPGADPAKGSGYYVSLDMAAALHPQTLLCYEMNGQPLTLDHGAPLRLIIPHKYGVKNLKRIGTIRYSEEEPLDYWAQQGYDSYLGL